MCTYCTDFSKWLAGRPLYGREAKASQSKPKHLAYGPQQGFRTSSRPPRLSEKVCLGGYLEGEVCGERRLLSSMVQKCMAKSAWLRKSMAKKIHDEKSPCCLVCACWIYLSLRWGEGKGKPDAIPTFYYSLVCTTCF